MADSRVGERYSVSIMLEKGSSNDENKRDYSVFNDAAIHQFNLEMPLNHLPYGSAKLVGSPESAGDPKSGTYGLLVLSGLKADSSNIEIPIYVYSALRNQESQDVVSIDISFEFGTMAIQSIMEALAFDGTSVEAANKLFSTVGAPLLDKVTPSKKPNSISDNMTWRFVDGDLSAHIQNVVEHASIPGDILYWSYDELVQTYVLGTFNVSKASKAKNFFMYTNNNNMATTSACHKLKDSETTLWYYMGFMPTDLAGASREARAPNMIIDSTSSGNSKDTGICSEECWRSILGAMGASPEYMTKGSYGRQYVIKPFPSNTHKTYSVAPFVRKYLLAEYSRMVRVYLYNHPGPAVGSCIYFYAQSAKLKTGDFLPDDNYTARYIVVGKRIYKDATVATGMLGKERTENTSDIITEITMVTNNGYAGILSPDYKAVLTLSNSVVASLKKETKK